MGVYKDRIPMQLDSFGSDPYQQSWLTGIVLWLGVGADRTG